MTTESDRQRIMRKSLAHVNRHHRKENPIKTIGVLIGVSILSMIAVIFFVENAQAIDDFFDVNMQKVLFLWSIPVGFVLVLVVMLIRWLCRKYGRRFWYRYKKM